MTWNLRFKIVTMKKIVALIGLAVALALSTGNYRILFNASLSDGKLGVADSLLREWSTATPDDPELYAARFNLLLNRARTQALVLSAESAKDGDQWTLTDSAGNSTGFIRGETTWDSLLVDSAFREIDRGISAFPDRIDFRLGKAAAAAMAGDWIAVIGTVDNLLDRDAVNRGHWFGSDNLVQASADTILTEAVYERLCDLYNTESRSVIEETLPLAAKAAKRMESNVRFLNLAGGMNYGVGNIDSALTYFEEAARIAPHDGIPLTNIAYINYRKGDTVRALEICRKIQEGGYDDRSVEIATQMIGQITAPTEDMGEYTYFFSYLPEMAAQTEDVTEFLDVALYNTRILSYNRMRSPFSDGDIRAEEFPQQGDKPKVVVWTFPMPERMPMCRYVAFVSDGKDACRIFTLEKSLEDMWVIGTSDSGGHSNYGDIPYPGTAAGFVGVLREKGLL